MSKPNFIFATGSKDALALYARDRRYCAAYDSHNFTVGEALILWSSPKYLKTRIKRGCRKGATRMQVITVKKMRVISHVTENTFEYEI